MNISKCITNIKTLKVQGAENIALYTLDTLSRYVSTLKTKDDRQLLRNLLIVKNLLINSRPTEPCMRNAIHYVFLDITKREGVKKTIHDRIKTAKTYLKDSKNTILQIGAKKISKNSTVFTHCHSNTVVGVLKEAAKHKKVVVYNTETRPLFQGRKTAQELAKAGIKVHHFVDSAARLAIKHSDMVLLGCDAITTDRIINKIGSEMFAEIAHKYDVPVYICTNSWKFEASSIFGFEEKMEKRKPAEVWTNPPKNVQVHNYAFERINPEFVSGIISELGLFEHSMFITELQKTHSWLFDI